MKQEDVREIIKTLTEGLDNRHVGAIKLVGHYSNSIIKLCNAIIELDERIKKLEEDDQIHLCHCGASMVPLVVNQVMNTDDEGMSQTVTWIWKCVDCDNEVKK